MKKLFLLFVSMMLTMVARADESGTCGLNLAWTFEDSSGTLTISGSGVMRDFALQRSPWYRLHEGILKVVIETGAASIGDFAFEGCSGLTSITIPEGVTIIESSTFDGCSSLASITIPKSVTSIRYRAFYNCTQVNKLTCYAETPPEADFETFEGIDHAIPVYVPKGSILQYKEARYWNDFPMIRKIDEESSISCLTVNDGAHGSAKLSVSGNFVLISGTKGYEKITVYAIDGRCIASTVGQSGTTVIHLPAPDIYVIKIDNSLYKIRN